MSANCLVVEVSSCVSTCGCLIQKLWSQVPSRVLFLEFRILSVLYMYSYKDGISSTFRWRTPRKQPPPNVTNTPTSTPHPVSPLVYSSPSIQNYSSSSPLVSSSTSLNRSMNSNTTPNVQYWTRQSTTPQRRTPHSLNGSVRTTPRRQAQARIMTPTGYGKLSFTPKGLKGL